MVSPDGRRLLGAEHDVGVHRAQRRHLSPRVVDADARQLRGRQVAAEVDLAGAQPPGDLDRPRRRAGRPAGSSRRLRRWAPSRGRPAASGRRSASASAPRSRPSGRACGCARAGRSRRHTSPSGRPASTAARQGWGARRGRARRGRVRHRSCGRWPRPWCAARRVGPTATGRGRSRRPRRGPRRGSRAASAASARVEAQFDGTRPRVERHDPSSRPERATGRPGRPVRSAWPATCACR